MIERNAEAELLVRSHMAAQTTDPQTLAYALTDSPVGTAAWIWERRRAWSDCHGDVTSVFSPDDLCTAASIYWLNGSVASSLRLYFEHYTRGWRPSHDRQPTIEAPNRLRRLPQGARVTAFLYRR